MGGCSFYILNIAYLSFDCKSLFVCLYLWHYDSNSSGRYAHLLHRPYENVAAADIQPIAKRFSMAGCVTVQGLSELLPVLNEEACSHKSQSAPAPSP